MSFNPLKLMQLKTAWRSFAMRLEFKVTTPDGNVLTSNMKVSQADLDLLKQIQDSFS